MKNLDTYVVNENLAIQSITVGLEQEQVLIIDDFMKSPGALVDLAASQAFTPYNTQYPGIKSPAPAQYTQQLLNAIVPIIAAHYELPQRHTLECSNCSFSLVTQPENNLNVIQRSPHRDSSYPYQFAVLLYLCNSDHGGTSFYRHNHTQFETISPAKSVIYDQVCADNIEKNGAPAPRYQLDSDERYSKIGTVTTRFNRLVIYRSWLLHSGCINLQKSIDPNPHTGRLTLNSFLIFS